MPISSPIQSDLEHRLGLDQARLVLDTKAMRRAWPSLIASGIDRLESHGDFHSLRNKIESFSPLSEAKTNFSVAAPWVSSKEGPELSAERCALLRELGPWKKGPFKILDELIDSEWQGQLKWDRLIAQATPLQGRKVLDVGTGNGYFLYRAHGEGAQFVLGLEPSVLYSAQYLALQRFYACPSVALLPLTSDEFTANCAAFDTVLSMGVLYHRRSPIDHLTQLKGFLRKGGELVLETIVIDGPLGHTLVPEGRYAQMKNVWFLPSVETLKSWLVRIGMCHITIGPSVRTTVQEQRSTSWSNCQPSLMEFLDPDNAHLTIEGHPAPRRVIITARVP